MPDGDALVFGFDIGIASVGWAVLAPDRIVAVGVRAFDKAETAKEGEPLNLARRKARLTRRRLYRRAWRLTKLARLLRHEGLIGSSAVLRDEGICPVSPWKLRVDGLDRKLEAEEWARVLYHLCKHRGFHWLSRAEERQAAEDKRGEGGKVKKGLAENAQRMAEKGYRSAAEMVLREFSAQRNKHGEYTKALSRVWLAEEMKLLFERQRALGNAHAHERLEAALLGTGDRKSGLFWQQHPPLSGEKLLEMLGRCTFERGEYRAPKASFSAERHVWLTRLNNLRVVIDGETRPLNEREHAVALPLPYFQSSDLTHKQLKAALIRAGLWTEQVRFAGLRYPANADPESKNPEGEVLVKLPAWQGLRKHLKDKGLATEWQGLATAALEGRAEAIERLDHVAWVLSVYKEDMEAEAELAKLALPGGQAMIDALLELRFDKFSNLSLKALRKIVPHMEQGKRYDEAIAAIPEYGHHSALQPAAPAERYLPPLYDMHRGRGPGQEGRMILSERVDRDITGGIPRNPVVLRALNQARKVMNALIRTYGPPSRVCIEMARDLSRPLDERQKIKREQDAFRQRNEQLKTNFREEFGCEPKSREFEKYLLYHEQHGKCAYSGERLDPNRVIDDPGYAEVDHALPYSRSFDDSRNNKVLVLSRENREKGNRTPYEYLDGANESPRWRTFIAFVEGNPNYRLAKKQRLLRKHFGEDEAKAFSERNLTDTRYVCRFFKNYVERYLKLAEGSDAKRCVVVSGQLTAFLRARWGLNKIRGESDRHHALDAAVVAACTPAMVKRLSDYARRRELDQVRAGYIDPETGEVLDVTALRRLEAAFPTPWPHFRQELEARVHRDDPAALRAELQAFGTYPPEALAAVKPLFVSRAPQRRSGGAAHKETIYAQPGRLAAQGSVTQRVPLTSLTLADLGEPGNPAKPCQLVDPERNRKLYDAIRARLQAHGGKADKAFPPHNPLRKPDRNGQPIGPIVRSVKRLIDRKSGIPIRGGLAENETMLRVDVFRDNCSGKFYLVPVYVHHRITGLPDRAIVGGKPEREWRLMDEHHSFVCSLYPNDLVWVDFQDGRKLGYYSGVDRGNGNLKLFPVDHRTELQRFGIQSARSVTRYHVDVLGNIHPAPPEVRRGLA